MKNMIIDKNMLSSFLICLLSRCPCFVSRCRVLGTAKFEFYLSKKTAVHVGYVFCNSVNCRITNVNIKFLQVVLNNRKGSENCNCGI